MGFPFAKLSLSKQMYFDFFFSIDSLPATHAIRAIIIKRMTELRNRGFTVYLALMGSVSRLRRCSFAIDNTR